MKLEKIFLIHAGGFYSGLIDDDKEQILKRAYSETNFNKNNINDHMLLSNSLEIRKFLTENKLVLEDNIYNPNILSNNSGAYDLDEFDELFLENLISLYEEKTRDLTISSDPDVFFALNRIVMDKFDLRSLTAYEAYLKDKDKFYLHHGRSLELDFSNLDWNNLSEAYENLNINNPGFKLTYLTPAKNQDDRYFCCTVMADLNKKRTISYDYRNKIAINQQILTPPRATHI